MEQATMHNDHAERRRKNFILAIIITIIVVYAAVPTYGIIRDISTGEHVFVLSSDLPGVTIKRPVLGFIDRFYRFFFPKEEVNVPVGKRIDLKGRVVYTDGTPYPNGRIELRSDPRYTRTDSQGYFIFIDVSEGPHNINVLGEAGNVLAHCAVEIDRTTEVEDAEIVHLSDGTFVFQVAVHVKVLEITVLLQKGDDGEVTGIDTILLGAVPEGTTQPPEPPVPPDPKPPEPEPPKPPGPKPKTPFDFDVLDTATTTSYGRAGAVNVNIFGANKLIAPGMSGKYRFTVDNTGNKYSTLYDVTFTATDTLPDAHKIPMLFRLKADGVYVAGNETTWCTLSDLYQNTVVAGARNVEYTLDWYWPDGSNDNDYAAYARNPDYSYSILIKVTAQAQ